MKLYRKKNKQNKKHKSNKLIQFAACTEHDREYTLPYFGVLNFI